MTGIRDRLGEPGKALTAAAAKTALRRYLLEQNPRRHREDVACVVEDFTNALDYMREQLESDRDDLVESLSDAQDALDELECDLEDERQLLIDDPRRPDREAIKARMIQLLGRRISLNTQIETDTARQAVAVQRLKALKQDKREFLAGFIEMNNLGGAWYAWVESRKGL